MWLLRVLFVNVFLLVLFGLSANAKGTIKFLHVKSTTVYRFNTVKITSRIQNDASTKDKLVFQVALPDDAFVTGFSMTLKNIHIEGRIVKQIQKMFTDRNKKEYVLSANRIRSTGHFKIIIHAPPSAVATFTLTYQDMLQRTHGMYEQIVYLTPGQLVEDLKVNSNIHETRNITEVIVPALRKDIISDEAKTAKNKYSKVTIDGQTAKIVYKPTIEQQKEFSDIGINGLYTIKYDIQHGKDKGDIILWNGYFIHFFSPSGLVPMPKDIVFVLDDSSSMTGLKLKQMKEAMYLILDTLQENDNFMFIQFSNLITPRKTGFVKATRKNIEAAKEYIRKTFVARGATNINGAIIEGLKWFDKLEYSPETRSSILLFLTDGRPTVGERIPSRIIENINTYNSKNAQIFAISFGADADFMLMQMISYHYGGQPTRIYEASDSAYQLRLYFQAISYLLMKELKISYGSSYLLRDEIAWSKFRNYFEGSEIIISGRVSDSEAKNLGVSISEKKGGSLVDADFLADAVYVEKPPTFMTEEEYKVTLERMWAFLLIKYWMRLRIMGGDAGYMARYERRIQEIAVKYGFLTQGSSMMLEGAGGDIMSDEISLPEYERDLYGEARIRRGKNMRVFADPHFMVTLPELEIPVCFEILAEKGDYLLLMDDPVSGVRVTASVIESRVRNKDGRRRTYLGEVMIATSDFQVRISPHVVMLNGLLLSWKREKSIGSHHVRVVITGSGSHVSIIVNNSTQMLIQRYLYAYKNPNQVNYLNFYVTDHTGLSPETSGLLGYFAHAHVNNTTPILEGTPLPHKLHLTATDRNKDKAYSFTANLVERMDVFDIEHTVRCWKVLPHENFALFGGTQTGKFFLDNL